VRDIRRTDLFREVEEFYKEALEPGFGRITNADDLNPSPDRRRIAFTGTGLHKFEGTEQERVCLADVETKAMRIATGGPNDDRLPKWSPDGSTIAFVSDRKQKGRFQLFFLTNDLAEARKGPEIPGSIEFMQWAPNGRRLLVGAADEGAEVAAAHGSGKIERGEGDIPEWLPEVRSSRAEQGWRRLWVYDARSTSIELLSPDDLNVWEAAFAGDDVVAIASRHPDEASWYSARLVLLGSGEERELYRSKVQLGVPAANPSGDRIAVIEAACSDRLAVAGDLLLISRDGDVERVDTGVDVTWLEWANDDVVLFSGVRDTHTIIGTCHRTTSEVRESWRSGHTCGGRIFPRAWAFGEEAAVAVVHGYDRYPEIAVLERGREDTVVSLEHPGADFVSKVGGELRSVTWSSKDGLQIQGYLLVPDGPPPYPLVVDVHGGPISLHRNFWAMRSLLAPLLVSRGYAVLLPNPRGSIGRGQEFAAMVIGDMGGADADDILSGVDYVVDQGVADRERIGVWGGSYGGFMTAWLVTHSDIFAAAVALAPVTDYTSQHYSSNIGFWDKEFLRDDPSKPGGEYFNRSPLSFVANVSTPTFLIAGEVDRCTPPGQAVEFHQAMIEHGVDTDLVIYPNEGHGIRNFPARIDVDARVLAWFERYMPV
jgi:dipeptidyl aminopeptidase/acylaminoacyl peptidase